MLLYTKRQKIWFLLLGVAPIIGVVVSCAIRNETLFKFSFYEPCVLMIYWAYATRRNAENFCPPWLKGWLPATKRGLPLQYARDLEELEADCARKWREDYINERLKAQADLLSERLHRGPQ